MEINGQEKAECHYCKKKLVGGSKNGTRHLHDHFKSCPKRTSRDIRQQVLGMGQKTKEGQTNLSCLNFDPEKSRKDLAEMVIVHEYPLVMVEHHGFRKFVTGLQPLFKVPSRNTLKNDILKIYDFEKQKTMRYVLFVIYYNFIVYFLSNLYLVFVSVYWRRIKARLQLPQICGHQVIRKKVSCQSQRT